MRRLILALGWVFALGLPLAYAGWDGNGTFSRVHDWTDDRDAGIKIQASRMDAEDDSFAAGINATLAKNGENSPTANLPMAGYHHLNVGNATARNQYGAVGQIQDGSFSYAVGTVSGGTQITMSLSPSISSYSTGMVVTFLASSSGVTGSATLNIDSVGAATIKKYNDQNLASGDIEANQIVSVVYDGTNFQMLNPPGTAVDSGTALLIANDLSDLNSAAAALANLGGVSSSINLSASDGISGGGTLAADRSFSLDIGGLTSGTTIISGADQLAFNDASLNAPRQNTIQAVVGTVAPVLLGTFSVSGSSLDITGVFTGEYTRYEIVVTNVMATTSDDKDLYLRASVASSFQSGASDYGWVINSGRDNGSDTNTAGNRADSSAAQIALNDTTPAGLGTGTNEKADVVINVWDPAAGNVVLFDWRLVMRSADGGNLHISDGTGQYKGSTSAVDGIRLLMESGNISATAKVYGYP